MNPRPLAGRRDRMRKIQALASFRHSRGKAGIQGGETVPVTLDVHFRGHGRNRSEPSATRADRNAARGRAGGVDEPAMIEALADGRLGGAALDVAAVEPLPSQNPPWGLDNVLISPHSASTVAAENGRIMDLFLENLGRFLEDRPLINLFDATRGY